MSDKIFRDERTASVANTLAALGNPTRLELVNRLSKTETFAGQSLSELAEGTGLTRQAITKHLDALAEVGLVIRLKPGRATWYQLKAETVQSVIQALTVIAKQRERSDQRLKAYKAKLLS